MGNKHNLHMRTSVHVGETLRGLLEPQHLMCLPDLLVKVPTPVSIQECFHVLKGSTSERF